MIRKKANTAGLLLTALRKKGGGKGGGGLNGGGDGGGRGGEGDGLGGGRGGTAAVAGVVKESA